MDHSQALALVVGDVRESYPELSFNEAIEYARNTISLTPGVVGGSFLPDDGTDLYYAYRTVLSLNGYIAFVEGTRVEVYASSLYEGKQRAAAMYAGRKKRPNVSIDLAELGQKQIVSVVTA